MAKFIFLLILLYYLLKKDMALAARGMFKKKPTVYEAIEEDSYSLKISDTKSETLESETEASASGAEPGELTAADIREAQNTDVGNFTTNSYHYYNFQGENMTPDKTDQCSDAFFKCMQSIHSNPPMICGMHALAMYWGYYDFYNYCELYLWNCMKGSREYRAISTGHCYFWVYWYWWWFIPYEIKNILLIAPGDPLQDDTIKFKDFQK